MKQILSNFIASIDWLLCGSVLLIACAGLVTMNASVGKTLLFHRQILWLCISFGIMCVASQIDWRFLKRTRVVMLLYSVSVTLLGLLFVLGSVFKGAQSWFNIFGFTFQPGDIGELMVVLVLAKYFSRRHVEIAHIRHIIVSGIYAFIIFILVFFQPDFGAAVMIASTWLGMVLVSGISKKHLLLVIVTAVVSFVLLWGFLFKPYQKERVLNFLNPLAHIRGSGYNAYQSMIAVGSGQIFGKGIGYGTQSKLQFLPEYQTDFIFAAFAEEWGFIGVLLLFILYGIVFARMLHIASHGGSNFEILFGTGLSILFMTHAAIHVGMNIGLLPVTGNTLPFMSYGGSHLVIEFLGIGILMGMNRYARSTHKDIVSNEIVGVM